ncbi:hypothetical protein EV360DRAFT_85974, partial [Lentinula raphanica]
TRHVNTRQADYGGTEIASALSPTHSSLPTTPARSVAVVLLTDGSAWDVSTYLCVSHTETTLATLPHPNRPSTILHLLPSSASSLIARAGNGMSVYVKAGESAAGNCARAARAARTPQIMDVVVSRLRDTSDPVQCGRRGTKSTGPPSAPVPQPLPPPEIQQVPLHLKNIFSGTRTQVYDIIRTPHFEDGSKGTQIPTSVKVKGVPGATGTPVEHVRFLHVLAANLCLHASVATKMQNNEELKEAHLKQEIIRLGTTSSTTTPTPTEGEAASVIPVSGFSGSRIAVQSRRVESGKAPRMQLASTEEGSRCNDSGADKKAGLSRARIASQTHARPRPAAFAAQQTRPSSSSTLMDVDQNPFEDTRPTKRAKGSSFSACLASTSTTSLPATLTIAECLTTVAHLQNSTASSLRHKPSSDC